MQEVPAEGSLLGTIERPRKTQQVRCDVGGLDDNECRRENDQFETRSEACHDAAFGAGTVDRLLCADSFFLLFLLRRRRQAVPAFHLDVCEV